MSQQGHCECEQEEEYAFSLGNYRHMPITVKLSKAETAVS